MSASTPPNPGARGRVATPLVVLMVVCQSLWLVALVATLSIDALHTGPRSWWPWCALAGLVLGGLAWLFVRRGRGNASSALV